ncbi:hypothetical protein [Virgisporangium ochraceum]|uniref:Secreted protein n=1 Tax=Virgisporangium ochraceum TaxID=65505 RepID=A0A8J4EFX2_9ACTN|nr:hypothetical protein [Virgisporangium ochraceum]GIJ73166.1 hypothetical protein Voc01_080830 [Virgisporangium ochraceum]
MIRVSRVIAVGGAVAALTLAGAAPAVADQPSLSVGTGTAVLTPAAGGGYAGQLAVRIRATGGDVSGVSVTIVQPAGLRFAGERNGQLHTCVPAPAVAPRALECYLPVTIAAGRHHDLSITLTSLAGPQRRSRFSEEGAVTVGSGSATATARFRALLVGTGPGVDPAPYRPATEPDLAVTAGPAAFVDNGDGTWSGRLPVTLNAATDAEHDEVGLTVTGLPAGSGVKVEGQPIGCMYGEWACRLDAVAQGARRTSTLLVWTTEPPLTGSPLTVAVVPVRALQPVADVNPVDNTTTTTVTIS